MSIALHSGKLAAGLTSQFLSGQSSRTQMEERYATEWRRHFAARLRRGRLLQRFFGSRAASNAFVRLFAMFPSLATPIIRSTHGDVF
ncbi:MAG: hypothetical protein EOO15_05090 [Chitinophagaceae bacterium]|nr:MAG: hypothetical protein EOO15_05090 [Chitinophagaceae bacterium]